MATIDHCAGCGTVPAHVDPETGHDVDESAREWTWLYDDASFGDGWSPEEVDRIASAMEDLLDEDTEEDPIWVLRTQEGEVDGLYWGQRSDGHRFRRMVSPQSRCEHIDAVEERVSAAWERAQRIVNYEGAWLVSDGYSDGSVKAQSAIEAAGKFFGGYQLGGEVTEAEVSFTCTPYVKGDLAKHLSEVVSRKVRR